MAKELTISSNLTIREKIAIYSLLILIRIVKPFPWSHEINSLIKPIEDAINKGNIDE